MSETKIRIQPNKGGAKAINLNRGEIENAISIAGTMKQAALYLNVSYNTFRRECMKYDNLWNPQPAGGKGKKRVTKHYINQSLLYKILRGENINSWRETVLLKRALLEKYLTAECDNCSCNYEHIEKSELMPLVIDFLDGDKENGKQDNLRILCLNCVYELKHSKKGWYKHRDYPINITIRELENEDNLGLSTPTASIEEELPDLSFTPFENFQKTLEKD